MLLSIELRRQLQVDRGLYVKEACDRCGKVLGPVRLTRRDDTGVWCSASCRGGVEAAQKRIAPRGGRPKLHRNNADKQRAYRASLRCYETPELTSQNQ